MADFSFEVSVQGLADAKAKMAKLERVLGEWAGAMRGIGEDFKQYYENVPFVSRGSIYGSPWPDLSPSYKSWKAEFYPGRPMMVLTGAMQAGFYFVSNGDMIRLSNSVEYFEKHQFGDSQVPQRIIMALTEERKNVAVDIIQGELNRKVKEL